MKQAWMGSVALATAMLCVVPGLVQAQEDITVTDKSFGCIRDGTKVRNTYIRNADPQRLAEAVRILRDRVANTEYPVGTFLQLVPGEAMVKHPKATLPETNGWEVFSLELATSPPPVTTSSVKRATAARRSRLTTRKSPRSRGWTRAVRRIKRASLKTPS